MVIQEFSFGNFRSFKDIQTLNMAAAKIKSKYAFVDEANVINDESYRGVKFLKSKAIYGANASGKSNIAKALGTFIRIIKQSVKDEEILKLVEPFRLSTETEHAPTFFQLIFWIENIRYRYGFELDDKQIYAEWLYAKPGLRELPYFIRDNQEIIEIDKTNFNEGNKFVEFFKNFSSDNQIFRNNSLFLSTIASLGFGKLAKEIVDNIDSVFVINGLGHRGLHTYAGDCLREEARRKYIVDFLKHGDTGIEDVETVDVPSDVFSNDADNKESNITGKDRKMKVVVSTRKKYDANQNFHENVPSPFTMMESEGTLKLFELSPVVFESLKENRPLIIDEFDARFHPLLTKKIIELFNSKTNKCTQLIFITHDTNLLSADLLRRDQIEFVEKDKFGASHLYSLVQFKGIRNAASFEKDYISGKYGAIPFLGDFKKLMNL